MTTAENATPAPTRAQAEKAAAAMLNAANATENLATRLKVAEYATWRARFDGMTDSRAAAGIANAQLFRGSDDALVVLADIPGFRDALAWAEGGWRTAIPADGVEGPPVAGAGDGLGPAVGGELGVQVAHAGPNGVMADTQYAPLGPLAV